LIRIAAHGGFGQPQENPLLGLGPQEAPEDRSGPELEKTESTLWVFSEPHFGHLTGSFSEAKTSRSKSLPH
jgi:hypothetical protein